MAKLDPKPYPFPHYTSGCDWKSVSKAQDKVMARLEAEAAKATGIVGALLYFPWADGRAVYIVTKEKPLTVQHVPVGDAWHVPGWQIQALTPKIVKAMVQERRDLAKLFRRG